MACVPFKLRGEFNVVRHLSFLICSLRVGVFQSRIPRDLIDGAINSSLLKQMYKRQPQPSADYSEAVASSIAFRFYTLGLRNYEMARFSAQPIS
jgi:hypothetical protein